MPKDERESACCVWDLTIPADRISVSDLRKHFSHHCKKYVFQLERGDKTGYEHYQCRVSLKTKSRKATLITSNFNIKGCNISVTSNANKDNDFYVLKDETRVSGPFADTDKAPLRTVNKMIENGLYPWQEALIEHVQDYNDRQIHLLIDKGGNIGKSALCKYFYQMHDAVIVPPLNDSKELMGYVMSFPPAKLYIIDMPRAMKKKNLAGLYSGIEQLKNGMMYDIRYHGKFKYIDEPNIIVFTNTPPKLRYLSRDRWVMLTVEEKNLVPFTYINNDAKSLQDAGIEET